MKGLISFIISTIIYLLLGIIAWNIVYSFLDINSMTLLAVGNYKLCTYSFFTFLIVYIIIKLKDIAGDGDMYFVIGLVIGINLIISITLNYWDSAWDIVVLIVGAIYNIVNIGMISVFVYELIWGK